MRCRQGPAIARRVPLIGKVGGEPAPGAEKRRGFRRESIDLRLAEITRVAFRWYNVSHRGQSLAMAKTMA